MTLRLRARWRWFRRRDGWTLILGGAVLIVLLGLTHYRNEVWRDPITLWKDVTAKSPDKPRSWFGLGAAYMQKYARTHDFADSQASMAALIHAQNEAQKRHDDLVMVPVETDMAVLMMHGGDYDSAAAILERVVRDFPRYGEAWGALATLHAKVGDPYVALSLSAQLIEADSGWRIRSSLYVARAQAYCRLGDAIAANSNYAVARRYDPVLREARCE